MREYQGLRSASALHIVHLNTMRGWGGGELQVLNLVRGLGHSGVRSTLLARPGGELLRRASECDDVDAHAFDFLFPYGPLAGIRLRRLLRRIDATVLRVHDGHAAAMGLAAARGLRNLSIVVHRHTSSPIRKNRFSQRRYRSDCITAYIAVSKSASDNLRHIGVPMERVTVIPGGVDLENLRENGDRLKYRAEIGLGTGPIIGTVGALVPKKDIGTFIRAAAILSQTNSSARFVVVGDGGERAVLEAQARAAGLGDRIVFTGAVPEAQAYIGAMDAFAFPSLREGSPGVVKEAMALGVPVVAARSPGTEETVPEGTGLLVPAQDAGAMAEAIEQVLEPSNGRERMVEAARAWVTESYSVAGMIAGTIDLYRGLSGEGS